VTTATPTTLSTHVLDTSRGEPARGLRVDLARADTGDRIGSASTDGDGRVAAFAGALSAGTYTLTFDTGAYFASTATAHFFPHITVVFTIPDGAASHYHVPLLLSPFAYSTYRGS
jgi:5-hydroxyisourate hydrolase